MPELDTPGAAASDPIRTWRAMEDDFRSALWIGRPSEVRGEDNGRLPLLISAPHGGHQLRDHWPKIADRGTGAMALTLSRMLGCAGVASIGLQPDDPNWDTAIGPYKSEALRLLQGRGVLIDLHAMRMERHYDLCIGTGLWPDARTLAMAQHLAARARAAGYLVGVNVPFAADRPGTMTSFTQATGRRALQIEINSRHLDVVGRPEAARRMLAFLADAAAQVAPLGEP